MCTLLAFQPAMDFQLQLHQLQACADIAQAGACCAPLEAESAAKFRGMCWDRRHGSWRCRIFWNGKQRHIGRFRDALVAARAYDRAAYFLYNDKAILNFSMEEAAADQGDVPLFIRQAKEQADAAEAAAAACAAVAAGASPKDFPASSSQLTAGGSGSSNNSSSASFSHAGGSPGSSSSWLASPLQSCTAAGAGQADARLSGPGWHLLQPPKQHSHHHPQQQVLYMHNGLACSQGIAVQPVMRPVVPGMLQLAHTNSWAQAESAAAAAASGAYAPPPQACFSHSAASSSGSSTVVHSCSHGERVLLRQALERQLEKQQLQPQLSTDVDAPHSMAMQLMQQQQQQQYPQLNASGADTAGCGGGRSTVQVLHTPSMPVSTQQQQQLGHMQAVVSLGPASGGLLLHQSMQVQQLQPQCSMPQVATSSTAPAAGTVAPTSVAYTTSLIGAAPQYLQQPQQGYQVSAAQAGCVGPHAAVSYEMTQWQQQMAMSQQQQGLVFQQHQLQQQQQGGVGMLTSMLHNGALQLS